jgi:hypothetical protein
MRLTAGRKGKGFHMELLGYDQVHKGLKLMKNQRAALMKFLKDEANKLNDLAKSTAPFDKGRLKDSHRVMTRGSGRGGQQTASGMEYSAAVIAGGISVRGRMVDYAAAVHEGNPGHPRPSAGTLKPRPWLRKALERISNGFEKRLARAIKIHKLGM